MPFSRRSLLGALAVAPLAGAWAAPDDTLRRDFIAAFNRPRAPLAPEPGPVETRAGLRHERVTVASEPGVRVPLLVVRQEGGERRPAVVCLHGLGGRKEGMLPFLEPLARAGHVAVALDARYHGDRAGDVQEAMAVAFRTGKEHPYLWDTTWDTWRVLDYLQTRADVQGDRLGVMGTSLGGHTTWMVSADPRVRAAAPCIAVCSWRWQLEHGGYAQRAKNLSRAFEGARQALGEPEVNRRVVEAAWERWLPGIPKRWDCQDVLAAMAPRALLVVNGDSDPVAPIEGVREAWSVIEAAYRRAGAADRARLLVAERSGHTVTPAQRTAVVEWFTRWLSA